jgi:hypothetical protein
MNRRLVFGVVACISCAPAAMDNSPDMSQTEPGESEDVPADSGTLGYTDPPIETDPPTPHILTYCRISDSNDCRIDLSCDGTPRDEYFDVAWFHLTILFGYEINPISVTVQFSLTPATELATIDNDHRVWHDAIKYNEESMESFNMALRNWTPGEYALTARARLRDSDPWLDCEVPSYPDPIEDWPFGPVEHIPPCGEPVLWPGFDPDHMRVVVVEGDPSEPACQPPPADPDPADTDPPTDTDPPDTF